LLASAALTILSVMFSMALIRLLRPYSRRVLGPTA
jgi:hypothetical protein